ncbi:MAG: NTP transferase domain-containing protein [Deltaproteobacteria bacterium]|nr:NTP transferase domain-containing protein [Deltaproteobacteria bacterium]
MSRNIRQAVIPMAGKGTRFYPITHVVPKEFLPILNRPLFHYILDQLQSAGVEEIICVIAPGRDLATPYVEKIERRMTIITVLQEEQKGLGHAIACAQGAITDDYFLVVLPDVLIEAAPSVPAQLCRAFQAIETAGLIATRQEPQEKLVHYGVIAPGKRDGALMQVEDLIEKPRPGRAPSRYVAVGQYILPAKIFHYLREIAPGANGEIQLTDALCCVARDDGLSALEYEEHAMFDAGQLPGWLAANIYYGRREGFLP